MVNAAMVPNPGTYTTATEAALREFRAQGWRDAPALFARPHCIFRWRSGGGKQAAVVQWSSDPGGTVLPRDPGELFAHISRQYSGCDWRETPDGIVEIAVPFWGVEQRRHAIAPPLARHLGRSIRVVPAAWHVNADVPQSGGNISFSRAVPTEALIEPRQDPTHGFQVIAAYIAPWWLTPVAAPLVARALVLRQEASDWRSLAANLPIAWTAVDAARKREDREQANAEAEQANAEARALLARARGGVGR